MVAYHRRKLEVARRARHQKKPLGGRFALHEKARKRNLEMGRVYKTHTQIRKELDDIPF